MTLYHSVSNKSNLRWAVVVALTFVASRRLSIFMCKVVSCKKFSADDRKLRRVLSCWFVFSCNLVSLFLQLIGCPVLRGFAAGFPLVIMAYTRSLKWPLVICISVPNVLLRPHYDSRLDFVTGLLKLHACVPYSHFHIHWAGPCKGP